MSALERQLSRFRRVVVWGHPLHSHTHSYVHQAFARAFRSLGVETLWTDDARALAQLDMAGTLFLTEGQVVDGMPLRSDCRYVLHNVDEHVYAPVIDQSVLLQVFGADVGARSQTGGPERINAYTYVDHPEGGAVVLYQPWATDLLPAEFNMDVRLPAPDAERSLPRLVARRLRRRRPRALWVGTIGGGEYGNIDEITRFRSACRKAGVAFVQRGGVDRAEHIALIRGSLVAPTIVGRWQLENGYVPCRIFKNISYGRLGATNSPWVTSVFDSDILYRSDPAELFWAYTRMPPSADHLRSQMLEVKERHTYVNRIATILDVLP